jgi:endonuclease/exonuclease/phosphatase family metal-dependent hydrolase
MSPRPRRSGWLFLALALAGAVALGLMPAPSAAAEKAKTYLFCFWNVENFFDDKDDGHRSEPDHTFDKWFAEDPKALELKLDNLSRALLALNDGKGPDILALAEVESERAAQLLADRLNKGLKDPALHYKNILFKDPKGGRSIATAIITRLDVDKSRTQLHGRRQRILEGHIVANGHELVILATHWTSRVSDKEGDSRDKYADTIYGRFKAMYKSNPKVDFLVCGDFNDPPDDDSVIKHLHAIGDAKKVLAGGDDGPLMLNLFADKTDGKVGSHYYRGKWLMFDQIAVSPGLLDKEGWTCEPETAHIVTEHTTFPAGRSKGHPMPFGNKNYKGTRGTSDHLPVTVRLRVAASK